MIEKKKLRQNKNFNYIKYKIIYEIYKNYKFNTKLNYWKRKNIDDYWKVKLKTKQKIKNYQMCITNYLKKKIFINNINLEK